jgi:hypothetical protein
MKLRRLTIEPWRLTIEPWRLSLGPYRLTLGRVVSPWAVLSHPGPCCLTLGRVVAMEQFKGKV